MHRTLPRELCQSESMSNFQFENQHTRMSHLSGDWLCYHSMTLNVERQRKCKNGGKCHQHNGLAVSVYTKELVMNNQRLLVVKLFDGTPLLNMICR